jgi:GxxExxY protein
MDENEWATAAIGAAIEVHKILGPGLLESTYEECLAHEFFLRQIPFERQVVLPLTYKGLVINQAYRLDLWVARCLVIEIKAVEQTTPVHVAQVITYLKLTDSRLGLLINFNVRLLKQGLQRIANDLESSSAFSASP